MKLITIESVTHTYCSISEFERAIFEEGETLYVFHGYRDDSILLVIMDGPCPSFRTPMWSLLNQGARFVSIHDWTWEEIINDPLPVVLSALL